MVDSIESPCVGKTNFLQLSLKSGVMMKVVESLLEADRNQITRMLLVSSLQPRQVTQKESRDCRIRPVLFSSIALRTAGQNV